MQLSDLAGFLNLQNSRLLSIRTPLSGQSALVVSDFQCSEGLSVLFDMRIGLASRDPTIELKQMIGQPVTVSLKLATPSSGGSERHFHGYVTQFSHTGADGGLATYAATVRPWLWMLSRRVDSRIFQDKSVRDILDGVFSQYAKLASYAFRLSRALKPYSYCTQYRETDLNFVLRLIEQEGLFYYFEHANDGHKLIVTDDSTHAKPIDGALALRYSAGEVVDDEAIVSQFAAHRQLTSSTVSLKTFDYKVPGARRYVSGDTKAEQGSVEPYEVYDYVGLHGFDSTDRGEELARFRLEALAAGSKAFTGAGNCRTLAPGRYFELTDHYDHGGARPEDRQFLLTAVHHHGLNNYQSNEGAASYTASFQCIRKKIPFRASLAMPRPVIAGPQTAIVVGPKGEEIYTDSLGRVKVQFHWDRLGQRNQGSSCWVRVGQPWAGGGFGGVTIPRIGDEVVVSFLDGDPDRPIIISRVYNAQNMPPWKLPENATQSGILSRSMKGHAGTANAIRFDDKQGEEELWLQAERDMRTEVEHDELRSVGNDHRSAVGRNHTLNVKQDHVSNTGNNQTVGVGSAFAMTVGALPAQDAAPPPAGTYVLDVTDQVVIRCGKSSITMTKDGLIKLEGVQIVEHASDYFLMQGKKIDLNP
ncbi:MULTISPECIES: type VI secretion system Vgr family protein [Burkholderia]|uniref:type VI secretion system Vgr family protein n=1 Tax=Burkholderia TaxID=32008 RepID=UPI000759EDC5|nr:MULTISPECIES: type VI secretion system tip protein VgrG [Burkholderia]AOJ68293.1 type IV secretion protein Rhs [Burkholderia savannae]KVG48992.1 type IV secretion protein Rhs [Burkholderia sp. MSMB0265]KVG80464.1 type IV secretion protein Rhs [Burkholderia sp. MSMB2040]KVG92387.1 type IV secretion protein Rhs [Burkholderia sp. MSMB2042]KVG94659.1 type IV secretion protein Rhs [Burkholderia sp. MSMB2041]